MRENLSISPLSADPAASAMEPSQFDQVVKAIIEGKYSWACLLVLRFAGYNPAHYIPYRTYKRIVKDNKSSQTARTPQSAQQTKSMSTEQFEQVVKAVIEGKYSWGCVLVLRFVGYNPVHYIPYRTYKRLIREHRSKQSQPAPQSSPSPQRTYRSAESLSYS